VELFRFETPLVRAYAVGEGVTRERESVNKAATRRESDSVRVKLALGVLTSYLEPLRKTESSESSRLRIGAYNTY
jgi:hypothetical protein